MSQPLTDQQLADIRRRHAKATGGTWYLQPNHGRDFVASEQAGYERGIGDLDFGVGDQADNDREFVLHAHSDMTALFGEVSQLRAELAENTGVLQALRRQRDKAETERDALAATLAQIRDTCTTVTADRTEQWDPFLNGQRAVADAVLALIDTNQPTT